MAGITQVPGNTTRILVVLFIQYYGIAEAHYEKHRKEINSLIILQAEAANLQNQIRQHVHALPALRERIKNGLDNLNANDMAIYARQFASHEPALQAYEQEQIAFRQRLERYLAQLQVGTETHLAKLSDPALKQFLVAREKERQEIKRDFQKLQETEKGLQRNLILLYHEIANAVFNSKGFSLPPLERLGN